MVFAFLIVSTWAQAQDDANRPVPLQAPSNLQRPGGPGNPGGPGGPIGDRVSLQFPLNPVNDILSIYERLINKPIVKDSSIFEGPQVSLVTPSEVSRDEAIRLIEAALLVNGYVLVAEPEDESVKILLGGARKGGSSPSFSEGVVIYTDPTLLPDGESLVGFFMELEFIDPEDAATIFSNHIVLNEFGRITPVIHPRGLLITETSPIVRQLIRVRSIIDHPVDDAPLITEFVQLEYAEANVVAQIIQAAMDARMEERQRQSESGGTVTGTRSAAPAQGGNQPPQGQPQGQQSQQGQQGQNARSRNVMNGVGTADQPAAQLIPDDRMNRVMIVASPSDAAYILELIQQFDRALDNLKPLERRLKYVKANDILPVLVDILQDTGTGETQLPGGRQIQTRSTPVTSSQLTTLTGTNRNTQNNQNRTQQTATEEVGGRADQISFPIDEVAPISILVGKTRIIADRQTNSIIVAGTGEAQATVMDMIDRLDRRPVQVYLATVIGEMTLTDDVQFGVDYLQQYMGQRGFAGGNINGRSDIIGPTNTTGNIANVANMLVTTPFGPASGLNLYGQIGQSLDVIITALESTQRFKVLSRPVVYTQNGKRAEITSGQEVPVPVESLSDSSGQVNNTAAVRTSIDFKEVVLKLEVLPTINEDDEVTLDIVQINDRVVGSQLVAGSEVPIIGKQELNTTVTVANRSTIILGGLISESKNEEDAGIPFLKNIPIIGYAAKTTNVAKTRSELMIFIQPVVVHGDGEAVVSSYDEDVRSEVGESAAQAFPEPGAPTIMHRAEVVRDVEVESQPWKRLGQKIFGKQKVPREPLP